MNWGGPRTGWNASPTEITIIQHAVWYILAVRKSTGFTPTHTHTYILQGLLRHSWGWRTLEFRAHAFGIEMFPDVLSYAAVIGPEEDTVWKVV